MTAHALLSHPSARRVPVSPTLSGNEAMARRRAAGLPVIPMAFGEAGLPVPHALRTKLSSAAGLGGYGPVAGTERLRAAAAGYWSRRDLPTAPEQVVCGPGSKPLLYALLLVIGGPVAVPQPSWVSYAAQSRLAGGTPVPVPILPGEGGVPDPARLAAAAVRARTAGIPLRAVIVTLPDNPTGTLATPQTVRRLCQVARDHSLIIISDEIYRDLVHEPSREFLSPAQVAPERTIVTSGLSKTLALGGWRIGVTRLPADGSLHADLLGVASELWSSPAAPVQEAAAYAYTEPIELTERVARSRRLHGQMARAVAARLRAVGATVPEPAGAFYLYPDFEPLRGLLESAHGICTDEALAGHLLERYGVGTLAGSSFGEPAGALRLRVATSLLYGDTDEQRTAALSADAPLELPWIARALDLLGEALTDLAHPAVCPTT
jgi:aspartate aminotransferase